MLNIVDQFRLPRLRSLKFALPAQFINRPKKHEIEAQLRMSAALEDIAASKKFRYDRVSYLVDYEIRKARRDRANLYCQRY